jgi:hypothetical protein
MNLKRETKLAKQKPVTINVTKTINYYFTPQTAHSFHTLSKLCPASSRNTGESQLVDDGKIKHSFSDFKYAFDYFEANALGTQLEEFCITLNTDNQQLNYLTNHNKVDKYISSWCKRNEELKPVYLIIAELNKSGMIHWHGVITFTWPEANSYFHIARFKDSLRKKFGRTVGKQVFSSKKYLKYISKDQNKISYAPLTNVPKIKPLSREAAP